MISRNWVFSLYILLVFTGSFFSNVSATRPSKIVSGILSNALSALFKWLWSLKPTTKIGFVIPGRSMMKFEDGYTVETVFDGSKLGIEPYSVEVTPSGELLVLDSQNSNIHKISTRFSRYRLPTLVVGSSEGYSGHVDGKPREARLNHPKGLTVDGRGNIYVADTKNMAIRKIGDTGVVTIAGGNWVRGSGHNDGPSDGVKFSNDFNVQYVASSCSILVVDRGNQAIREIQLHDDDCSFHHYDGNLHLGIAVLSAAVFCGFMLALLQRRISAMLSSPHGVHPSTYQTPVKSVRQPLIPPEVDEQEKEEDGFFDSLAKLFINTGSSLFEILSGFFSSSKKKPVNTHRSNYHQYPPPYFNTWPMQETFVIPNEDPPPLPLETRNPTSRKSHPEKPRHSNPSPYIYGKHSGKHFHQQQQMMHYPLGPQTYYQENNETTNEVIFGAVQEHDRNREDMFIKCVDYGNPSYGFQNLRPRYNYMGYAYDMY